MQVKNQYNTLNSENLRHNISATDDGLQHFYHHDSTVNQRLLL